MWLLTGGYAAGVTAPSTIIGIDDHASFWDDEDTIGSCLREPVPRVPPWFGYDELGSRLFEEITELPTYYLTRVERDLLARHAPSIARRLDCGRLAELGSGSARKTRLLLEACTALRPTTYLPVDVSREMLESSSAALREVLPDLAVTGLWGRYEAGLARLRADAEPVVVAMLGSNLGNTTPAERTALLADIAATLSPGDGFLVSVDLRKPAAQLEACYNDPPGRSAFARFRRNHLTHLNRRFGSAFDTGAFDPRAHYDEASGDVEGHLRARSAQHVPVPGLGLTVDVPAGGTINVGFSAKFDRDGFVADVAAHGPVLEDRWIDEEYAYGIFLFRR